MSKPKQQKVKGLDKFKSFADKKGKGNEINPLELATPKRKYSVTYCSSELAFDQKSGTPRMKMRITDDEKAQTSVTLMVKGYKTIEWIASNFDEEAEILEMPSIEELEIPEKPFTRDGVEYTSRTLWLCIPEEE